MGFPFEHKHLFAWSLLAAAIAFAGCEEDPVTDDDDDSSIPAGLDVLVEISPAIATVVTLSWSTADPSTGAVSWGLGADRGPSRESASATDHAVQLRGLASSTEYGYTVVSTTEGEDPVEVTGTFTTGDLPPALQQIGLTVSEDGGGDADGGFLYTPLVSGDEFPVILDRDGNVVWYHEDLVIPAPRILAVKPSCDGQSVWFNSIDAAGDGIDMAWVVRVSWDGTEVEHFELLQHNHTFVEIPDGDVAMLFHDTRPVEDDDIRGDRIMEMGPDGSVEEIWSVWDHFEYDGGVYLPGTGWTHANALEYDPTDDAYYVGLRNLDCIVKVDRATGETQWVFGGPHTDFDFDGNPPFAEQHEFQLLDGSILIFDNGTVQRYYSQAVEVSVDTDTWSGDVLWNYTTDPTLFVPAGGDVQRLPSGNTLITWSTAGQIDEVTPEGDLVWQARTDLGAGVFYTIWEDSLYETDLPGCGD